MKKLLSFLTILFLGVICTACVNTFAVHELNQISAQYIEKGEYDNAISRLESAIDLDDSVYETRYNIAVAYLGKKDCENALKNIGVAQRLSSDNPQVYYTKGVIYDCLASQQLQTNEEGTDPKQPVDLIKYSEYLASANENYTTYLNLEKNAKDRDEVNAVIEANHKKIHEIQFDEPDDSDEVQEPNDTKEAEQTQP